MKRNHISWCVLGLVAITVAAVLVGMNAPLANDGVIYLSLSRDTLNRSFGNTVFPPGLPVAIAALSALGVPPLIAARVVMFAALACLPILLGLAFRRCVGNVCAIAIGLCWIIFPLNISIGRGVWSEPLFYTLALAFIVMPDNTSRTTWGLQFIRGTLGAASYLVRPEGLIIFAVDTCRRLFANGRQECKRGLRPVLFSVVVFVLCIAPYVLFLHHHTGNWTLSGKTSYNLAIADRMSSENVWVDHDQHSHRTTLTEKAMHMMRRYGKNAKMIHDAYLILFSLPGLLLMGCGAWILVQKGATEGLGILVALAAPCTMLPLFFFVESRLLFGGCLAGVALVGIGLGSHMKACHFTDRSAPSTTPLRILACLLALAYLTFCLAESRHAFAGHEGSGEMRRNLGTHVRDQARGENLMSISLVTPFYAHAKSSRWPVQMSSDDVYHYACSNNIRFIEVSNYDAEAFHPSLLALLDEQQADPRFKRVHSVTSSRGDVFCIFRIEIHSIENRIEASQEGARKELDPSNKAIDSDEE